VLVKYFSDTTYPEEKNNFSQLGLYHKVYATFGSHTRYYLLKSELDANDRHGAPNPYVMLDVTVLDPEIPNTGDLMGYFWTNSYYVEEIKNFKDNEEAEAMLLQFEDDIMKVSWEV
jgi:hypothetical protein